MSESRYVNRSFRIVRTLCLNVLTAAVVIFALPKAHAQQSVDDFLKTPTYSHAAIDNYGPITGSPNNPAVTYKRECTQTNPTTISCRVYAPPLTSGGGKCFGPWYWIAPEPAPAGYKFQSASFSLPARDKSGKEVDGPDKCYGDASSPVQPLNSSPTGSCVVDNSWTGHKSPDGNHHAYAVCYIQREDANGPKWMYNLQGQEGGCSGKHGGDVIYSISCRPDGHVFEAAELDVVYVKGNS